MVFSQSEAVPVVTALLPNKTRQTYTTLFRALRDRLLLLFGNIGCLVNGTAHFDFEKAAILAFKDFSLRQKL